MSTTRVPVPPSKSSSPGRRANAGASIVSNSKTGEPDYVRHAEAQARALQRFEAQQQSWERAQAKLATAAGKPDAGASVAAATHLFRAKVEEIGKLDGAVPPAARSHASNSWEMNLRNGASATRYEPVGSSFPYPLYCPIRAPDQLRQDNPAYMHVLYPPSVTARSAAAANNAHARSVTDSGYFKSRQAEFQGAIAKKFAHFAESEYFEVRGEPAPRISDPADAAAAEEALPAGPVQFVPMPSKDSGAASPGAMASMNEAGALAAAAAAAASGSTSTTTATHAITIRNLLAQQQQQQQGADHKSVSTSGGIQPFKQASGAQAQQQVPSTPATAPAAFGPMLVLSTNNLSFATSSPQETKQAIVTLENTGTTAIFYNWSALPSAPPLLVTGSIGGVEPATTSAAGAAAAAPQSSVSPAPAAPPAAGGNSNVASPSTKLPSPFTLSNPVTGSILPGAHKMFCFSFRAAAPGVFVQHMELVTVPSGRERIVVTLRGVSLAADADAVSCEAIEAQLRAGVAQTAASEIVRGGIVHNVAENAFAVSDAAAALRRREQEIEAEHNAHLVLRKARAAKWAAANAALAAKTTTTTTTTATKDKTAVAALVPLPFNEPAFAALEQIRARCAEFRDEFEALLSPPRKSKAELAAIAAAEREAAAAGGKRKDGGAAAGSGGAATPRGRKGDEEDAEPPPDRAVQLVGSLPAEWGGSLRGLVEDVNAVRTAQVRRVAADAVSAVHRALAAAQEHNANKAAAASSSSSSAVSDGFFESETAPLSNLVWLGAGRTWLGNAFDKFERAEILAGARVEGRALCVSKGINMFGAPGKKGGPGGGAAGGAGGGAGGPEKGGAPAHGLGADLAAAAASTNPKRADKSMNPGAAAAAAAAASAIGGGRMPTCGATVREGEEEAAALMHAAVNQLLLGAVEGMISTHDADMAAIEAATALPLSALIVDSADKVLAARDLEAEPVLDLNNKKRK